MKIVHISSTGVELGAVARAYEMLRGAELTDLTLIARSQHDLYDETTIRRTAQAVSEADALLLVPHGGSASIPGLMDILNAARSGCHIHVQPSAGSDEDVALCEKYAPDFGTESYRRRVLYLKNGGVPNIANLYLDLAHSLGFRSAKADPPQPLPYEGIYHPECADTPGREAYFEWQRPRLGNCNGRPVIGVWFYRTHWINGNLHAIDSLIREIEKQGCIPLAVFHRRMPDADLGNGGAPRVVREMFCRDGSPMIDVLISSVLFSLALAGKEMGGLLRELDVPVLQLITTQNPEAVWRETLQAVTPQDISMAVAQPEFDGNIITTVGATREIGRPNPVTGAACIETRGVPERLARIVSLARNWAILRRTPASQRKVAIIFHHYPPRNDRLGCAHGLDSFASVKHLLDHMRQAGYAIDQTYENGDELAHALLERLTNDRRFLPPEKMAERAVDRIRADTGKLWHHEIPDEPRNKQVARWGEMPGTLFTYEGETLVGGLINGNVYIGLQPTRGRVESLEEAGAKEVGSGAIHDPDLPPPHNYPAIYRWMRECFGAHAVLHIGKHGSLEWLPGKSLGLSENCFPDLAIADLPNLYPYIVNNPGEGAQAKRRSYCCILDHLIPAQMTADASEPLAEAEKLLEELYQARVENPARVADLAVKLWNVVEEAKLHDDLHLDRETSLEDPDTFVEVVHSYINEVAACAINNGLHIFGQPPEGERFSETMGAMMRLPNDGIPSLLDAVARAQGLDPECLRDHRGEYDSAHGMTNGQLLRQCQNQAITLLSLLEQNQWQIGAIKESAKTICGNVSPALTEALRFAAETLRRRLEQTTDELDLSLRGLDGRFVPPGASGAPTRGRVDVLPTGRNFYSLDPFQIPDTNAWEVGRALGDALVERYRKEEGKMPEQVAIVVWSSPTMRTRGDDVAEILYLLGVRPVWQPGSGRVKEVEIIPATERTIPRLDVTVRTSGMFRDAFPNVMELIDRAVRMVAALDEPEETNFLARNAARETAALKAEGLSEEEALRQATLRVFSGHPGTYGAGVNKLLDASVWDRVEDLGKAYVDWSGYAYGEKMYGKRDESAFRRRMASCQVTVKNQDSRESDILSSDDYNSYHGGMNAAVKFASGKYAMSLSGDSSDPRKPFVRTTAEEGKFVFRARVLNPKWITGMKRHGYKGAGDMSRMVDIAFQWDATSGILEDWQYQGLAETYALDPEMQQFFREHNPDALYNVTERLLEAIRRGMWHKPGDLAEKLESLYLEMEGELEERL